MLKLFRKIQLFFAIKKAEIELEIYTIRDERLKKKGKYRGYKADNFHHF